MLRENPSQFFHKDRLMKKIGVAGLQREQIKKPLKRRLLAVLKFSFTTTWNGNESEIRTTGLLHRRV